MQEFRGTERFEILNFIGRGGMGVVYRAFDRDLKMEVALKTLLKVDPDAIYRMKKEFRLLADIRHPNLVTLHELFCVEEQWFFTMEYLRGMDFLTYVRGRAGSNEVTRVREETQKRPDANQELVTKPPASQKPGVPNASLSTEAMPIQNKERLWSAVVQTVRGVRALHMANKRHRDLKPANVFVTNEGRVVLLDFGLAAGRTADNLYEEAIEDRSSGTPAYMAPEQHAGTAATEASDWFAVGVMLYEALVGHRPFSDIGALMRNQPIEPAPPTEQVRTIFPELTSLCMQLLRWAPHERPKGDEILLQLGEKPTDDLNDQPAAPTARLFGRQAELQKLSAAFSSLKEGHPVSALVHGKSGLGKTALVRHFLADLTQQGAMVFTGRCFEQESVPFKVFDSLIDSLSNYLKSLPRLEVEQFIPRDVSVLARMFPVMLRIPSVADAPRRDRDVRDSQELQARAVLAFKELFGRISDRRPLVLFVDDLQWGDIDSARLLGEILRPPDVPKILLVLAYRREELATNAVLQTLLRAADSAKTTMVRHEVAVDTLAAAEIRDLAASLLHEFDSGAGAVEDIVREAQGNPLFTQELARHVARGQVLGSLQLSDVLTARIASLPDHTRQLLNVIALAGRPVKQGLVAKVAELGPDAWEALMSLVSANLARTNGKRMEDLVEVFHDRIRETVTAMLSAAKSKEIHGRIALALEAERSADADALGTHWRLAGNAQKACEYLLVAARRADATLAFDRACEHYTLALDLMAPGDARRTRILTKLGDSLRDGGRGPAAATAYLQAAELAEQAEERTELKRRGAEQLLASGHVEEGREVARLVLAEIRLAWPSTALGVIWSLVKGRIKISLRGTKFHERAERDIPRSELFRIDTCSSMAKGLSMMDSLIGADFATRGLLLSLAAGDPIRVARGLPFEAVHVGSGGNFVGAKKLLEQARALNGNLDDDHCHGLIQLMSGIVSYFQGSWRTSRTATEEASKIFAERCAGLTWETSTAHFFGLWSLIYLGDWQEMLRCGQPLLVRAHMRGNRYLEHCMRISYGILSPLMNDDIDGARRELAEVTKLWVSPGFQVQHFLALYLGGWVDLYAGDGLASWKRIDQSWKALKGSLLLQLLDPLRRTLHIRAYSALEAGGDKRYVRYAASAARRLARLPASDCAGISLVIRAAVALRRDKTADACRLLVAAALAFDRAEMKLFAAAARRRHGEITGGTTGKEMIAAADALMRDRGIKNPERMAAVFAPGFTGQRTTQV